MKPQVCVPLVDRGIEDIVESAKKAKKEGADLLELRLDFLPDLTVEKVEKITKLVKRVGLPTILTIRKEGFGGHFPKEREGEQINLLLAGAKNVNFVDIELETDIEILKNFIKKIKKLKTLLIISSHDFEKTPPVEKVLEILEEEKRLGADVYKFICKANTLSDNLTMLTANQKFIGKKIVFCMGKLGILSRVLSSIFGSELTFASLKSGKESAPGQLDIRTTKMILSNSLESGTKICCIIGDPVEHSLSPLMHNVAFRELGLNFTYIPLKVKKEMLQEAIEVIRRLGIRGVNVTIPHKVAVMKFLDDIDDLASEIGAVNTIVNNIGKLTGLNTDGMGAVRALKDNEGEPKDKKVVIIGAGGACRAISYSIAKEKPKELIIINRTVEKASEIAKSIKEKIDVNVKSLQLKPENLKAELKDADIVINSTSVGMSPNVNETVIPKEFLHNNMLLMDIVYNPLETRLIKEAKEVGVKTIDGIEMLVNQGIESFKIWTGKNAPVESMRKEVLKALGSEKDEG